MILRTFFYLLIFVVCCFSLNVEDESYHTHDFNFKPSNRFGVECHLGRPNTHIAAKLISGNLAEQQNVTVWVRHLTAQHVL